jgi:hypothetical protein
MIIPSCIEYTAKAFSGFKNPYQKIREIRKLETINVQHFVERKNEVIQPETKLESEKTRVYAQKNLD